METAPVKNQGELAVLYALADRANDDGTCAWPSQEWIASRARCSARTVRTHLNAMEKRGLIRRGNPKFVEHIRADQRPIVWDIDMESRAESFATTGKSESNDRKIHVERPENSRRTAGKRLPTNRPLTTHEPSINQQSFDEWWEVWPKKVAKGAARTAYKSAMKKTTHDNLMACTRAAVRIWERDRTEKKFIPFPATWLNQERWEDETLKGVSASSGDLFADAVADPSSIGDLLRATGLSGPSIRWDGRPRDVAVREDNLAWLRENESMIRAHLR